MDPPEYSMNGSPAPRRSVHDLRSQIIANASVLKPHMASDPRAHIEVVLAKLPDTSSYASSSGGRQEKASLAGPGMHYAILLKRGTYADSPVKILTRGEPRATVEEALEWMLERTEEEVHGMMEKYDGAANEGGCRSM